MAQVSDREHAERAWRAAEAMARRLNAPRDLDGTLAAIGQAALEHIAPAAEVGVILLVHGRLVPQLTTGPASHALDRLQQELGDGPCVEAARTQQVVWIEETASEPRWPEFSAGASAAGVTEMLCVPLWTEDRRVGTLSLYGGASSAFTELDLTVARLFAAQAAIALSNAQRGEQLQDAVESRDLIGQAKGILMERRRLTAEDAFHCLSLASQAANVKLIDIARHLVDTGELIGIDVPARRVGGR